MATIHTSDQPLAGQIEGGFRRGARQGFVAAGDLATSLTAAKAAVAVKAATMHVSDRPSEYPVQKSLDLVDGVLGTGLSTGGSLTNIYAVQAGTWDDCGPVL